MSLLAAISLIAETAAQAPWLDAYREPARRLIAVAGIDVCVGPAREEGSGSPSSPRCQSGSK